MTRHGRNATANSVYSYSERRKDQRESGWGTLHERLGADSIKEFDCCSLTLQPCRDPVVTPDGYVYDKEAILEYIIQQRKENVRKLKLWEKQRNKEQNELADLAKAEHQAKVDTFKRVEGTPAHPGSVAETAASSAAAEKDSVSNMVGKRKKNVPSFWIPDQLPTAAATKVDKPDNKVFCPMSGKVLKLKDLLPITFTKMPDDDDKKQDVAKKSCTRYMCAVTHDVLTNTTPCAVLKTSGNVVTLECVERLVKQDWVDPTNGKAVTADDILVLQRGGTGFASTNTVKAKLSRPVIELQ